VKIALLTQLLLRIINFNGSDLGVK